MEHNYLISPAFEFFAFLGIALAGYVLAARLGQSAILGQIVVGLIVGPSLLGLISYTEFVKQIAEIGAIVLLFVIGTEFKLRDVFKIKYLFVALAGVIVPFGLGYLVALMFGFDYGATLLVAVCLTATSIAITAHVLKENGTLDSEMGRMIIGAAVIDDVLGLIVLSVGISAAKGSFDGLELALLVGKAIAFMAVGAAIGILGIRRFVIHIDKTKMSQKYPETAFIIAIATAFLYAAIAELVGLSGIVGAFLAGSCLAGIELKHSKSYTEGAEYLRIIFAAFFFVSLGVIADLSAFTWELAGFTAILTLVAMASKVFGCGLPALAEGMNFRSSLIVGTGMIPRGEVAMIAALIGLNAKVIDQGVYLGIIAMSLLTTIIAPVLLKKLLVSKPAMSQ